MTDTLPYGASQIQRGKAPPPPGRGWSRDAELRFRGLGLVPLHGLPDGPGNETVDALSSGGGVGANGLFLAPGHSQQKSIIIFTHIFINSFLLGFSGCQFVTSNLLVSITPKHIYINIHFSQYIYIKSSNLPIDIFI